LFFDKNTFKVIVMKMYPVKCNNYDCLFHTYYG